MRIFTFTILFIFSSISLAGSYQSDIEKFFKTVKEGEIDGAVDELYRSNPYVSARPEDLTAIKNQLKSLPNLVGELNYLEKLDVYALSDLVVHVTYLATYERRPVRFEFQYFKVESGWRLYAFSFDAELSEEVKMIARERALKKLANERVD